MLLYRYLNVIKKIYKYKNNGNTIKSGENMKKSMIIGLIAGFISGFFATGGGMLLVPSFLYILKMDDKKARATAIICILPMVVASGIFYYTNNYIDWKMGLLCASGGIVGGYLGAKLLKKLDAKYFKVAFICFLIYTSIKFLV